MQILFILPYISFLSLGLGLFVLSKNLHHKQNRSFFIMCLGVCLWVFGLYWMNASRTFYWPDKVTLLGGLLAVTGFYVFSLVFPNERKLNFSLRAPWELNIYIRFLPAIFILLLLPFNLFIKELKITASGTSPVNGPLFPLLALIEIGYIIFSVKNFYKQFKESIGYKRQQISYLFSGFALFLISASVFDLVLPQFGISAFKFLGPLSAFIFLGFSTAAIVSYSLKDVRVVFGTFIVNILSALILIVLAGHAHDFIRSVLGRGRGSLPLLLFFGLLIFFVIRCLLNYVSMKIFFKNYHRGLDYFGQINIALNEQIDPKDVIMISNRHLQPALNLNWIYFFDYQSQKIIYDPESFVFVPSQIAPEQIYDSVLNAYAQALTEPQFFTDLKFETFFKPAQTPIAILPLSEGEKFFGYFLLGPQKSINGLSAEQIRRTKAAWAHIQTAYTRALLRQGLEQRVTEQVQEIKQAQKQLEEETRKRLDFLRSASHQLRTPITAMSSSLQLLVQGLEKSNENSAENQNKELADIAFQKSKNLASIVRSMLTLAKIEQSTPSDFTQKVDLNEAISAVLQALKSQVEAKGLVLEFNSQPNVWVLGNQTYLEQVLMNIAENAVEQTAAGSITIEYIFEPSFIIVKITDTGPGISEEYRDQIFHKHVKSSRASGSGLGLYIAKAIIAAHAQAHIWFESERDKGTTFYVRLVRI